MIEECMAGYFQFSSKVDGLYITVYPPKERYNAASIDDVMYYVDQRKIECNSVKLMEAVKLELYQKQQSRFQMSSSLHMENSVITE